MKPNTFSPAAKVGLTTLVGAVVLAFFVVWIGKFSPTGAGYQVTVTYDNVGGLLPGANVQLMGVKVGEVVDLEPRRDHVAVRVNISRPNTVIPTNAAFLISSKGIVGDRVMEIHLPKEPIGELHDGDVVKGQTEATIADLTESAGRIFKQVQAAVEGSDNQAMAMRTRDNIDLAAQELPKILARVDRIASELESLTRAATGLVNKNSKDVTALVAHAKAVTEQAEAVTRAVAPLVTSDKGKQQLGETLDRVHGLASTADQIAKDVAAFTGDETMQADVRELVTNAKEAAQNAKVLTKTLLMRPVRTDEDGFKINVRTELLGSLRQEQFFNVNSRLHGNFNVFGNLGFGPIPYYRLGLDDIGETNLLNLQLGMRMKDGMVARFGLVRNKLGIGTDVPFWGGDTLVSGELYDIVTPHVRLGLLQNLHFPGLPDTFGDYGISLYWDNQFRTGVQEVNLGVRWQPHN